MNGGKIMFYKVLFLLTLFNLIKSGKSFIRENVITVDGKVLEIPMGKYISLGMTMLFYIMVMAICCLPSMMF